MLAQLQRFTTIGAIILALLWAGASLHAGQPIRALGGAALIVGSYALVLALEFVLLGLAHGADDPTPRSTLIQRASAWWLEVGAAPRVFCWRQPFHSEKYPNQLPPDGKGRQGVLFVHGFFCNRGLWNPWLQRLSIDGTPFIAVNLEPVFGSIDNYMSTLEIAVRALEACTGRPPIVVAHSMGGLAVRRWWAENGDHTRVKHVITIGTPHHGTWIARLALSPNAKQMQLASPWLANLEAREPPGRARQFTCFYSNCDNIVFPPATATLTGANNQHLTGQPHVHMADLPEPWQELQRHLRT